jgi:AsmA protein
VRGNANSNGKTASVTGAVTMDQMKLAPKGKPAEHPVALNLALAHDLKARRGNIARSALKLGSAAATLSGSYDLSGDAPVIDVKLDGPGMALPELLAFLPALDVQLPSGASIEGGTVNLGMTSRGSMKNLNTAGSIKIEQAKLNYDLGAKLRLIQQLAAIPTDRTTQVALLAAEFETNSAGTTVRGIRFDAPSIGLLTGEGTVSPQHQLDFRMKAVVKTGGMVAAALKQRGETTTVPFSIRGTSSDPSFTPDVKALANEKLQQVMKNPEGAVKNATETVRGVINLFKKAPKDGATQK